MNYTVGLGRQFSVELSRLQEDQQDAVYDFIAIFQMCGLGDQTKYPGRISPSWHGLATNHPNYVYASTYSLWHYHAGLPTYHGTQPWGKTSDWLVHFQWVGQGSHINLVDFYTHHNAAKQFYIPTVDRLQTESSTESEALSDEAPALDQRPSEG